MWIRTHAGINVNPYWLKGSLVFIYVGNFDSAEAPDATCANPVHNDQNMHLLLLGLWWNDFESESLIAIS